MRSENTEELSSNEQSYAGLTATMLSLVRSAWGDRSALAESFGYSSVISAARTSMASNAPEATSSAAWRSRAAWEHGVLRQTGRKRLQTFR